MKGSFFWLLCGWFAGVVAGAICWAAKAEGFWIGVLACAVTLWPLAFLADRHDKRHGKVVTSVRRDA